MVQDYSQKSSLFRKGMIFFFQKQLFHKRPRCYSREPATTQTWSCVAKIIDVQRQNQNRDALDSLVTAVRLVGLRDSFPPTLPHLLENKQELTFCQAARSQSNRIKEIKGEKVRGSVLTILGSCHPRLPRPSGYPSVSPGAVCAF